MLKLAVTPRKNLLLCTTEGVFSLNIWIVETDDGRAGRLSRRRHARKLQPFVSEHVLGRVCEGGRPISEGGQERARPHIEVKAVTCCAVTPGESVVEK